MGCNSCLRLGKINKSLMNEACRADGINDKIRQDRDSYRDFIIKRFGCIPIDLVHDKGVQSLVPVSGGVQHNAGFGRMQSKRVAGVSSSDTPADGAGSVPDGVTAQQHVYNLIRDAGKAGISAMDIVQKTGLTAVQLSHKIYKMKKILRAERCVDDPRRKRYTLEKYLEA